MNRQSKERGIIGKLPKGPKGEEGRRTSRVEREMRQVIANYLTTSFRGDMPGFVSVTRVIVSKDLRQSKVLFTVLPKDGEPENWRTFHKTCVMELQNHAGEVQAEVNSRLRMKYCPRITFIYDEGFDNALRVDNILRELRRARGEEG